MYPPPLQLSSKKRAHSMQTFFSSNFFHITEKKKEEGGKTNLFLLHFHFPPIWNCESRAQCHCVFPLSLFLKWHSVTTRGEGERNRRIKHFPPPWRFTRDSFQLGHMLPSTDIWHDIFYRSFNFFLEFKLSKDYFKILIPMRLSKGIVI